MSAFRRQHDLKRPLAVLFLGATLTLAACTTGTTVPTETTYTPEPLSTTVGTGANILMITADDATATDLEYMPQTQKLLVEQGTTFSSALSPTPICVPARATLLTGQYAVNHGALTIRGEQGSVLSFDDEETLPVWLNQAGYETAFVGKYLNGYGKETDQTYIPPGWSDWQGSIDFSTYNFSKTMINNNGTVEHDKTYNTDGFAERVNEFIAEPERGDRPWYMWVNYVAPHNGGPSDTDDPIHWEGIGDDYIKTTKPAKRHKDMFKNKDIPNTPDLFRNDPEQAFGRGAVERSKMNKKAVREAYQQRLESLQAVDEGVASHIKALRDSDQLQNTYIVFSSDNGYFIGQHNLVGKLLWYDESLNVPMVVRGPDVPRGVTSEVPVTGADLPVTFADIAGATPTREVDGENFLSLLAQKDTDRVVPIAAWPVETDSDLPIYAGVRDGNDWKYVLLRSGKEELYDLKSDPYELNNLANNEGYANDLGRLRGLAEDLNDGLWDTLQERATKRAAKKVAATL